MPTYEVRDPRSNRTVTLTGDSPPTEQELHQIFAQLGTERAQKSKAAVLPDRIVPSDDIGLRVREGQVLRDGQPIELMGSPLPVVLGGSGYGSASAAAKQGATMAQRAMSGAKTAVVNAAPTLKYEAIRSGLQGAGVPPEVATTLALLVAGTGAAKRTTPRAPRQAKTTPTEAAAPASPPASSPAAAAPQTPAAPPPAAPAAPSAPRSSGAQTLELPPSARTRGQMSPQWIQNDLAVAARRANVKLTEPEFRQAETLVRQGQSPVEAVASVKGGATPTPPAPSTTKPKMSAAETREYTKLRRAGKTHEEASQMLESQRALTQTLGTTPVGQMDKAVRQRQRTGRWGDERK
jgi:hypothetical protein